VPTAFTAREGKWIGAKFGVFASRMSPATTQGSPGLLKVNYVRVKTL
jgi:hypothetical protein